MGNDKEIKNSTIPPLLFPFPNGERKGEGEILYMNGYTPLPVISYSI
jgi:hypothetical protein